VARRLAIRDDKPPCTQCTYAKQHKPAFLSERAPFVWVCTHASALRINDGSVWSVNIARPVCKGRRFEHKR
jgi:hypothetical protein